MIISNHLITGKTKFIAHIGFPTKSFTAPKILNPYFNLINKDLVVIPMACKKQDLKPLINGLTNLENFCGALITMPHKEEIVSLLKKKKKLVKISDVCNILKTDKNNHLIGGLTDIKGFKKSIKALKLTLKNKKILIVGAGGIGTSLSHFFLNEEVKSVRIHDINKEKANNLNDKIQNKNFKSNYKIWNKKDTKFDVLINSSPVGMVSFKSPVNSRIIKNCSTVIDFVLSDKQTKILKLAKKFNKQTISGNSILIHQIPAMLKFFGEKEISDSKLENLL